MLLLEYAKVTGISFQAAHKRVQRARASGKTELLDGTVVRREP
jgi:DNA-directed RNA polymerase specialized sigma24 family protein